MDGVAKTIRWSRFVDRAGRGILVPIESGLTFGPLPGIESLAEVARWIGHPAITGVIAHKGMVERLGARGLLHGKGVMVHLNGMTSFAVTPNRKEHLTTVEAALRLGADAVSLQLNFDANNDAHNLCALGAVVDQARGCGLPVLTMLYDKAPRVLPERRVQRLRHLVRACVELGTDALELPAPVDLSRIPLLLEGIEEHTAVFFAGGEVCSDEDMLGLASQAMAHGARGLCVGCHVFQHESASGFLTRLQDAVCSRAV